MLNKEVILLIKEHALKMIQYCDALLNEEDIMNSSSIAGKTKSIERLLLTCYRLNRTILPVASELNYNNSYAFSDEYEDAEMISITKDEISLRLPVLPHKTNDDNLFVELIHSLFFKAISDGIDIPQMRYYSIEFVHVYPSDFEKRLFLDNDNYNIRGVINAIAIHVGSSDSGLNCYHSHQTKLSDEHEMGTYITIKKRSPMDIFFHGFLSQKNA